MTPVPTWRLAVAVVISAWVALVLPLSLWWGLAALNGVVVLIAAIDYLLAPSAASVPVERRIPGVLTLGSTGRVHWRVSNPLRRTLDLAVADRLAPSLGAADRRFRVRIPPRGAAEASTSITPSRRGRFAIDELVIRSFGPLGLMAKQGRRKEGPVLRVHPAFRSRAEAELRIDKARILEVGLRSARGRGGGTDFDQLREYTADDEFRRIDWAATARAGKPIVREFRAEQNQTVINLLDNGRIMAGQVAEVPRVELAMDAVMMLTAVATRLGDKCGLVAFDRSVRAIVPPSHQREQLGRVVEAMYDLQPQLADSDYVGAFSDAATRFTRRAMFVIYTDLVEQSVGESLLPALPQLARSHLVVVAAVRDPDVEKWRTTAPGDAEEAYRHVAAVAAAEDRRRTTGALRAAGALVVDEPPDRLATVLADTYLQAKATARL